MKYKLPLFFGILFCCVTNVAFANRGAFDLERWDTIIQKIRINATNQNISKSVIDETLNDEIRLTVIATGFEDDSDKSVLSTPEQKVEHKIETTVKSKEEVNTEKIDPLLDLDRESVNIPSFLRSRK